MWQNTAERERERERERSSSFISVGIIKCSLPAATYSARWSFTPGASTGSYPRYSKKQIRCP